jgi:hypothetical protein
MFSKTYRREIVSYGIGPVHSCGSNDYTIFFSKGSWRTGALPCSARGCRTTGAGAAGGGRRRPEQGRPEEAGGAVRPEDGRRATGGRAPDDQRRPEEGLRATGGRAPGDRRTGAGRRQRRALAPHRSRGKRPDPDPEPYPVRSAAPSIILRKKR